MILRSYFLLVPSHTANFSVLWLHDLYVDWSMVYLTETVVWWAWVASCLSLWRRVSGFGLTLHGGLPALRCGQPSWGSLFTLPPINSYLLGRVVDAGCLCCSTHVGSNNGPYIILLLSCSQFVVSRVAEASIKILFVAMAKCISQGIAFESLSGLIDVVSKFVSSVGSLILRLCWSSHVCMYHCSYAQ